MAGRFVDGGFRWESSDARRVREVACSRCGWPTLSVSDSPLLCSSCGDSVAVAVFRGHLRVVQARGQQVLDGFRALELRAGGPAEPDIVAMIGWNAARLASAALKAAGMPREGRL